MDYKKLFHETLGELIETEEKLERANADRTRLHRLEDDIQERLDKAHVPNIHILNQIDMVVKAWKDSHPFKD